MMMIYKNFQALAEKFMRKHVFKHVVLGNAKMMNKFKLFKMKG